MQCDHQFLLYKMRDTIEMARNSETREIIHDIVIKRNGHEDGTVLFSFKQSIYHNPKLPRSN